MAMADNREDASLHDPTRSSDQDPIAQAIDRSSAEHYVWGEACDGWHLLDSPDLSVIHERVPAGAGEVRHYHSRSRQFFFALVGSVTMEFDGDSVTFDAGQGIHVPPGMRHRLVNRSQAPVEFLVVSSPPTAGDRINDAPLAPQPR